MKSYQIILVFIFINLYAGCKNNKSKESHESELVKNEETVIEDTISTNSKIVLVTDPDSFEKLEFVQVINYNLFYGFDPNEQISEYTGLVKEGSKLIIPNISEPQILEIRSGVKFNGKIESFHTRIYAKPGDSLSFMVNKGKIIFTGTNAANYNFFSELDPDDLAWSKVGYQQDLMNYKSRAKNLYESRKAFLENYRQQNPGITDNFVNEVEEELYFEYLFNLLAPRSEWEPVNGVYINTMQGLNTIIEKNESSSEAPFDITAYLDDIKLKDFNQSQLVGNDYYQRSLEEAIRSYFSENESTGYTIENFKNELQYIQNNIRNPLATTLQGKLIRRYYFNGGFGRGSIEKKFLQNQISLYKEKELTASQAAAMDEIENKLQSSSSKIPSSFLEEKIISFSTGDTLSLKTLLKGKRYKILYFDRYLPTEDIDMQEGNMIRKDLEKSHQVKFIYINLNKSSSVWKKRAKLYEDKLGIKNQYRLLNVNNSNLLRFLSVRIKKKLHFPMLSLIDINGKVLRNDLPLPSTGVNFQKSLEGVWRR